MDGQEDMAPQIREVRTHTAPPDQALLGGKRHMARIEDITLKDSGRTSIPSVSLQENDDLFGSLSQIELEEVMRAVRKRVLPKSALEELDSKTSINDLDFDTLPLVALSDKPQVEEEEDVQMLGDGEEDVMPMDLNAGIEDEATPAPSAHTPALHTSPIPLGAAHTSPIPLQGEDDLDQVAAQAALQLVPFPNPVVARQLLTLGEEERQAVLTFFPAPRREEVQILLDQAPDPNAPASARAAYARYQAPEPLPLEPGATVAAPFE
ncbi:Pre-mRNA-processing factor 17, partial [Durusdinium trenchii]